MLVAVTGGIGSGKSEVIRYLASLGHVTADADLVAREVIERIDVLDELKKLFGERVAVNGRPDRRKIAEIVFSDADKLAQLNAVTHPIITAELLKLKKHPLAFCEVPLLFESGAAENFDLSVLVTADEDIRCRRVMHRSGLTRGEVLSRMAAQMGEEKKRLFADRVIENNGSVEQLHAAVDGLLKEVLHEDKDFRKGTDL